VKTIKMSFELALTLILGFIWSMALISFVYKKENRSIRHILENKIERAIDNKCIIDSLIYEL